jgi:hypothetical protein
MYPQVCLIVYHPPPPNRFRFLNPAIQKPVLGSTLAGKSPGIYLFSSNRLPFCVSMHLFNFRVLAVQLVIGRQEVPAMKGSVMQVQE